MPVSDNRVQTICQNLAVLFVEHNADVPLKSVSGERIAEWYGTLIEAAKTVHRSTPDRFVAVRDGSKNGQIKADRYDLHRRCPKDGDGKLINPLCHWIFCEHGMSADHDPQTVAKIVSYWNRVIYRIDMLELESMIASVVNKIALRAQVRVEITCIGHLSRGESLDKLHGTDRESSAEYDNGAGKVTTRAENIERGTTVEMHPTSEYFMGEREMLRANGITKDDTVISLGDDMYQSALAAAIFWLQLGHKDMGALISAAWYAATDELIKAGYAQSVRTGKQGTFDMGSKDGLIEHTLAYPQPRTVNSYLSQSQRNGKAGK